MNEIYDEKKNGKRVDFNLCCEGNLSDEEMISKVIAKHPNLKTMEITLGGRKYKVSPVEEELTLLDCISDDGGFGVGSQGKVISTKIKDYWVLPTEAIAEKVLLYGLLQSVANKLNEGSNVTIGFAIGCADGILCYHSASTHECGSPIFATKTRAEQAIRIFANSKFDLKKLYQ